VSSAPDAVVLPLVGRLAELDADAQNVAQEALTELRHVMRGIHSPILTDRGWSGRYAPSSRAAASTSRSAWTAWPTATRG
jgi:hypothetical protein